MYIQLPDSEPDSSTSFVRIWMSSVFFASSWLSCVSFSLTCFSSASSAATLLSNFWLWASNSFPIWAVNSRSFSFCNIKTITRGIRNQYRTIYLGSFPLSGQKYSLWMPSLCRRGYSIWGTCYIKLFTRTHHLHILREEKGKTLSEMLVTTYKTSHQNPEYHDGHLHNLETLKSKRYLSPGSVTNQKRLCKQ